MSLDLRLLHATENFHELFRDPSSPVYQVMEALQRSINDENTTGEALEKKRSRLAGMKAVHEIVVEAHAANLKAAEQATEVIESRQERSRVSFPWLPRFMPRRTVPGHSPGRLATGG